MVHLGRQAYNYLVHLKRLKDVFKEAFILCLHKPIEDVRHTSADHLLHLEGAFKSKGFHSNVICHHCKLGRTEERKE